MTPVTVSVTFKKAISDGNYGTESAEVHISADLDPEAAYDGVCAALLNQARWLVNAELAASPSIAVRRSLQPQIPAPSRQARAAADDESPF